MPSTISIALIVLGAVLILVSIVGGKFKIFGAEIDDETTSRTGRIIAMVLGLIFVAAAIIMDVSNPSNPNQSAAGQQQADSSSGSVQAPAGLPTPSDNTVLQPVAPSNTGCPAVPGVTSLTQGQWVGPLTTANGASYDVTYDQNYIYLWDNSQSASTTYNNPATQGALDQWDSVSGAPLKICEDDSSNFYAAVSQ